VILNNQAVLLKGVNDDPEVLAELQNGLVAIGVNPYYVFQCRPVKRVKHHFQVPLKDGYRIVRESWKRLNGYSKRFRYVMSHRSGKLEIVGVHGNEMYFLYHQARDPRDLGKLFMRILNPYAGWIDELKHGASHGEWDPGSRGSRKSPGIVLVTPSIKSDRT
jgi:L-lysine 2,3-aminomutase